MEKASKKRIRDSGVSSRPQKQNRKSTADEAMPAPVATPKAATRRDNSNVDVKKPDPGASDQRTSTLKRKNDETPDKKPKKVKAREDTPDPCQDYDDDDDEEDCDGPKRCRRCDGELEVHEEDRRMCFDCRYYHPGKAVKDPSAPCWKVDTRGLDHFDLMEHHADCQVDGYIWDCCGKIQIVQGCKEREFRR
ncbi:hypothetical protein B0T20DRAFT_494886 [Sordaria brevicollis]|uniref:Uncharacterized protein n=1 Tax=Sordaria brevicollis TaxID=83679 RepID=A0AAE0PJ55_SORBR|nr:hypothetical protein B0T20DRAFT_494886 [Sordaria brevicollis]